MRYVDELVQRGKASPVCVDRGMKLCSLILLLVLSGCCAPRLELDELPDNQPVSIELLDQETPSSDGIFRVRVRFYERTEYQGLLQELDLGNGLYLVEYFRMDDGRMEMCHKDVHFSEKGTKELRKMKLYPADVAGVDYRRNFAMLPQNMDGSVRTTTGPNFNAGYLKNHQVRGRVVRCDQTRSAHWKIEYDNGKLVVTIPEEFQARR